MRVVVQVGREAVESGELVAPEVGDEGAGVLAVTGGPQDVCERTAGVVEHELEHLPVRRRRGINTGPLSAEARPYADFIAVRAILVDGRPLAALMIEHHVGVSVSRRYDLKRIDSDYFLAGDEA